jgi:hypothetical protein
VPKPGYMPEVTYLHRAVDHIPVEAEDFRSMAERDEADGKPISEKRRANRSYMEGISCWATIEQMRIINARLGKPFIVTLEVAALAAADVESEYNESNGHHDLYGDREPMMDACRHHTDEAAS